MIRTQVQLWYNWFKEDRQDVNDDARPGCPSTSTTVRTVKEMRLDNRRITIREVGDDVVGEVGNAYRVACFKHETCDSEDCSKIAKF